MMTKNKLKTVDDNKSLHGVRVKWDDSKMHTTFSNVVNVISTREEVSIFFGSNQTWNRGEDMEIEVKLSDRILANPYTAKRLSVILAGVISEYEARFGPLGIGEKSHTIH
jgi:hypothetical protein